MSGYKMSNSEITAKEDKIKFSLKDVIFTTIFTIAFILQIFLMFFVQNQINIPFLFFSGWILWIISLYFAFIPFFAFKKRGGVVKGKSYINTSKVVKDGSYAIIRHPQYLSGILFSISMTLWNPVWYNIVLSIIIIILTYQWTYAEDKHLIGKFGQDYETYKSEVPRLNLILGFIKYFAKKNNK
ncbi:MAG: isoprenylcysteine carboxylmethyltransferase family protein [Promethearchaeota archaeon]|nr:MAG: isoprenylcysteine carboxylmethyltransferase family protein [Candidatus Lokiarchaeota archaeon]